MTSRSDLDKPATLLAALLGLLVIAVALPFTIAAFPQTPKQFDATWGETALDAQSLSLHSDSAGSAKAMVTGDHFQPASLKIDVTCTDVHDASTFQQKPAMLHLKLSGGAPGAPLTGLPDTVPCKAQTLTVKLGDHADVAGAQATKADIALKNVWLDAMAGNVTAPTTYTLEVTPSRDAAGVPTLPVGTPPTSLDAKVTLTLNEWSAVVNEHQKEVTK